MNELIGDSVRKIVVAVLCGVLVVALPVASLAQTGEVVAIKRPDGPGANTEVALALSRATDRAGVGTVLIARDDQFADALASGVLQAGAPLMLVPSGGPIPPAVADRLAELAPTRAIILGGDNAVSPAVETELSADYAVERRAGASRLETAIEVARADASGATTAILARAFPTEGSTDQTQAFADSLAAGGWSATTGWPVLLTQTEVLSDATAAYLAESAITDVRIIGGTAAISAAVESALGDMGITVTRVSGPSRFGTAIAVAAARGSSSGRAIVVEGQAGDAWAAGFAAARRSAVLDAPIVLTTGATLPEPTEAFLAGLTGADEDPNQLTCVTDPAACAAAAAARGADINPFTLEASLLASNPMGSDYLGVSVDVDGDRMVVGGVRGGNTLGRAVVYERDDNGVWQEVADLRGDDDLCTAFGSDVTIDGDTVVVGSPRACGGSIELIDVFRRDTQGVWSSVQTIQSPNDNPSQGVRHTRFGGTLSLDDGTLFTGTYSVSTPSPNLSVQRGQVDIFRQAADGTFALSQSIEGPGPRVGFGTDVTVQGDRAVVSALPINTDSGMPNPVFVLQRDATGAWAIDTALDVDALLPGNFPQVDLDGDVIAVGDTLAGEAGDGAVIVFRATGGGWGDGAVIDAADGAAFGSDVAFFGDLLMVGASGGFGRVYAFAPDGEDWAQVGVRGPDRPQDGGGFGTSAFGSSLAVAGDRLFVGTPLHTETEGFQGVVFEYTFSLPGAR